MSKTPEEIDLIASIQATEKALEELSYLTSTADFDPGRGIMGPQGATGATGAPGADGNTLLNGSGAPSSGLGADGDFYLDTFNKLLYGPKTAGDWGTGVSYVGPTGAPGPQGTSGNDLISARVIFLS